MKILVTGSLGFVGQSLILALKERGIEALGVTRQHMNANRDDLISIPDFTAKGVWCEPLLGCDVVIHLAARAHRTDEKPNEALDEYIEANVTSTLCLAKEAIDAGVRRLVYVSSIGVHGDQTINEPFTENSPINPKSSYAHSKWLAEQGLIELSKKSKIELVILRPPLVFGPNNPGNMLKLINLINTGVPLPFNSIKNARSFIYVGNLLDALILCATHPKAAKQTYLVSDGEDISTPQLFKKMAVALGKSNLLLPFPLLGMHFLAKLMKKSNILDKLTQSLVIDSSKIRRELDWKPPFTLEQGLKVTAGWYQNH